MQTQTMFEKYGPVNASDQLRKLAEIDKRYGNTPEDFVLLKAGVDDLAGEEKFWAQHFLGQNLAFVQSQVGDARPLFEAGRTGPLVIQMLSVNNLAILADMEGAENAVQLFDEAAALAEQLSDQDGKNMILSNRIQYHVARDQYESISSIQFVDGKNFRAWELNHSIMNSRVEAFKYGVGSIEQVPAMFETLRQQYKALLPEFNDAQRFRAAYLIGMRQLEWACLTTSQGYQATITEYTTFLEAYKVNPPMHASGLMEMLDMLCTYSLAPKGIREQWADVVKKAVIDAGAEFYITIIDDKLAKAGKTEGD
ncbi:MAG: hypothetical protein JNK26_04725 [Candidatus Doudnabacteria bacterium]|nr:hypothetical protein [Candidatus Doudnabacteria bacterium]